MCSTTGNGDAPENADAFWRHLKSRSLPKNHLEGTPFAVLALGDTNYDKFCHMGKSIDKRLHELGAVRVIDLHCADEACNLEEIVEAWKRVAFATSQQIVDRVLSQSAAQNSAADAEVAATTDKFSKNCHVLENGSMDASGCLPQGLVCVRKLWRALGIEGDISEPPTDSALPAAGSSSSTNLVELITEGKEVPQLAPEAISEWSVERPFLSRVVSARWLSKCRRKSMEESSSAPWGSEKDIVEVRLSLEGSCIEYQPGDSFAVCVPNPARLVNMVINRLNEFPGQPVVTAESLVRKPDGSICALGEFISFR